MGEPIGGVPRDPNPRPGMREGPWRGENDPPPPPREVSDEEYQRLMREEFRNSAIGKKFRGELGKVGGFPNQVFDEGQFAIDEARRIQEETDKRTRELETQLWSQARGEETPSQKQFAEQLQQTQRLQKGMVGSVRGLSGERARRYGQDFGSRLETEGRPRLASIRATEMQDAEEALTRFQGQRDALALQYLQMAYSAEDAKRMADLEYQNMIQAFRDQKLAEYKQRIDREMGIFGGITGAVGRIAAMFSDKNTKQNVSGVKSGEVNDFLGALKGYTYEYKDEFKKHPQANDSKNTGIMAQDLEKSSIGRTIIKEVDVNGRKIKAVDNGRFVHALAAAVADMNNRLNKLKRAGA